jgi:hypothetical protein
MLSISLSYPFPEFLTLCIGKNALKVRWQPGCPAIYRSKDNLLGALLLGIIGIPQQGNGLALPELLIFVPESLHSYLHRNLSHVLSTNSRDDILSAA